MYLRRGVFRLAQAIGVHYVGVSKKEPPLMILGRSGVGSPMGDGGGEVGGRWSR